MNIKYFLSFISILTMSISPGVFAQEVTDEQSTSDTYPPIHVHSFLESDFFIDEVRASGKFESVEKEVQGRPIGLDIRFIRENTPDNAQIGSALLSLSTLGLTPIQMNNIFKIALFVEAHNTVVFRKVYELPRKETVNIWSLKADYVLRDDERVFIKESLRDFLDEIAKSDDVNELFSDYWQYLR